MRRRVLLVTFDAIGPRTGGSAIRVLELARALSATGGHVPIVAAPAVSREGMPESIPVHAFDPRRPQATLAALVREAETVVIPFHGLVRLPFLRRADVPLVVDLYDPIILELLEAQPDRAAAERTRASAEHVRMLNQVLRRGDFFLCASERQRDLWIGALAANGRIVAGALRDPDARDLIDVVPSGMAPEEPPPPPAGRVRLSAALPAIGEAKTVIVWGGGIWDWLDPITAIQAMALLEATRSAVHLVFLAGPHPSGDRLAAAMATKARATAAHLGLAGHRVHFIDEYLPHADWRRCLREADAGVSTHTHHLESHFSFRTRILDYLSAGLPVICTRGDVLADAVASDGLGVVVPERDPRALACAFERIADDQAFVAQCR